MKLKEVRDNFIAYLTDKEAFDLDSQRIRNNCNKVQCMLREVEPLTLIDRTAPFLSLYTHIQQEISRLMGIPKEYLENDSQAEKNIQSS